MDNASQAPWAAAIGTSAAWFGAKRTGDYVAVLYPRLSAACQVAMGITMSYLLVQML